MIAQEDICLSYHSREGHITKAMLGLSQPSYVLSLISRHSNCSQFSFPSVVNSYNFARLLLISGFACDSSTSKSLSLTFMNS